MTLFKTKMTDEKQV